MAALNLAAYRNSERGRCRGASVQLQSGHKDRRELYTGLFLRFLPNIVFVLVAFYTLNCSFNFGAKFSLFYYKLCEFIIRTRRISFLCNPIFFDRRDRVVPAYAHATRSRGDRHDEDAVHVTMGRPHHRADLHCHHHGYVIIF